MNFVEPGHIVDTANSLPNGNVGRYAYWRTGADSINNSAFRMLDVQTTARA